MIDNKNVLIFEVWGNPSSYRFVEYHVELLNKEFKKEKCKSTLKALLKSYENSFCILFFSSTMGKIGKNYDEIIKSAEEEAKKFLENQDYCGMDYRNRVEIKIIPGIGRFKDNGEHKIFEGRINQIRTSAFILALDELNNKKPNTVILDISHGVNYMPVYIRDAVFDALIAYVALCQDKKIKWIVYNSEPVQEDNVEANIQLVEDLEIDTKQAFSILYSKLNTVIKKYGNSKFVPVKWIQNKFETATYKSYSFSHDWDRLYKLVKKFVKSVNRGLILLLPYIKSELENIDIKKLKDEFYRFSYINCNDEIVRVDQNKSLVTYLVEPKIEIYFILTSAELINNIRIKEIQDKYELEQLKEIGKRYIIEEAAQKIVENELEQIKECVEIASSLNIKLNDEEPYNVYYYISQIKVKEKRLIDIYRREKKLENISLVIFEENLNEWRKIATPDERNFYAHAGLERNITNIIKSKEKIWIRYSDNGLEYAKKYAEKES
ncbi:MAG: CRISPR-associated CARF protein Csx1 [Candidatus Anstonellales archaeon]